MTFTNLINRLYEYQDAEVMRRAAFIKNGVEGEKDRGIRTYITETRWNQYQSGKITRAEAVVYAIKRMTKQIAKDTAAKVAHLERVAAAADLYELQEV